MAMTFDPLRVLFLPPTSAYICLELNVHARALEDLLVACDRRIAEAEKPNAIIVRKACGCHASKYDRAVFVRQAKTASGRTVIVKASA